MMEQQVTQWPVVLGGLEVLDIVTGVLLLIAVLAAVIELFLMIKNSRLDRVRITGMLTSYFCAVPAAIVDGVLASTLIAAYYWVAGFGIMDIRTTPQTALLTLLLVDFLYYCEHRLAHRVNLLWAAYHSVHHSAEHYDISIAFRISFVDFFFSPIIYLPLLIIGFDPILVLTCFGVVLAYQVWIHTESITKLTFLDGWLNTPSNHRVHHSNQPQYIDKNYGGILIIWDKLFASYAAETTTVVYGLTKPLKSNNPLAVHGIVWMRLMRQLSHTKGLIQGLKLFFYPPGAKI